MPFQHEEQGEIGSFWSWAIVIVFCVAIVAWGIFNSLAIDDPPRRWDMGAWPDVPGQSVYSTVEPAVESSVPRQIAPLPEGTALP